jgi:hypothetical protein
MFSKIFSKVLVQLFYSKNSQNILLGKAYKCSLFFKKLFLTLKPIFPTQSQTCHLLCLMFNSFWVKMYLRLYLLENKEPLQHIKNISLIFSPISFLIFLPDFLNIFHFNISWLCTMISGMCSPLLAYIFISFVIKITQ